MAIKKKKKRYYNPNINSWKYIGADLDNDGKISDKEKDAVIENNLSFFNWTVNFTKKIVTIAFIIFVLSNIFIVAMIYISYMQTQSVVSLDTYITEVYEMFISVIGGYIIKSATENTVKIAFSVLSDWLDKKYNISHIVNPEDQEIAGNYDQEYSDNSVIDETSDGSIDNNYTDDNHIEN